MSHFSIRKFLPEDLAFSQRLREIAGWNQTLADWKRLLDHEPEGCFVCEFDAKPAGTATTTRHGNDVGWIGMVLVDPDHRRQGVATRLLLECISYLKPNVGCIKLDATPAGMKVYTKLGFTEEWRLHRWKCNSAKSGTPKGTELRFERDEIATLDSQAFGGNRIEFLQRLARDSETRCADEKGFGMRRPGAQSHYLGPVVADSIESGRLLISSLLPRDDSIIWDIPDDNHDAIEFARELGFEKERPLIRMRLGSPGQADNPTLQWAIGGPETG